MLKKVLIFSLLALQNIVFADGKPFSSLQKKEPMRIGDAQAALSEKIKLADKRVKLMERTLNSTAKQYADAKLAFALVQGENLLFLRDDFADEYLPLGRSSRAILSLAIGAMESCGMLDSSRPARDYSPLFRVPNKTLESKISLRDLYAMRAGIASKYDELFDTSRPPQAVFDAIYMADPNAYGTFQESALSVSAAAYIVAMRFDSSEENLNTAYFNVLKKFILQPLKIKGALAVKMPFPADRGVALNIRGIAAWLSCETSFGRGVGENQVTDADLLDARYELFEGEKRSSAFTKLTLEGMEFFASADDIFGASHIVIINRHTRTGFAVFAKGADKTLCMSLAAEYARLLSEAVK